MIKNDHDDNYIHASKIFANAIFMPPAGCITKQLLSFNRGPNFSREFNLIKESGSNPINFLALLHPFLVALVSNTNFREYTREARVVTQ